MDQNLYIIAKKIKKDGQKVRDDKSMYVCLCVCGLNNNMIWKNLM